MSGICVALCVVAAAAHAQPMPRNPQTLDETLVVAPAYEPVQRAGSLATGSTGSTMDTPFSVTTVPAERVREQGGTTLQDALRNVPGAQADSGFNGSHTQFFSLRGAVSDSGTGSNHVLRDGVRLSNYPYVGAFVDSVEVLRGPGAAMGVRSEPGGTVAIQTRRPQLSNFGSVSVMGAASRASETSVDLNRVLSAADELALRITATRSDASEWRHVPDRLSGIKLGVAKSDGGNFHLRAGIEATDQTYAPDYGLPAIGNRPVNVPRDRQLGEPFGTSTLENRVVDLHGDVALTPDTRVALDLTRVEAHSSAIKNFVSGAPLARQLFGTFARVSAWEPDTQRRIDSVAASLTTARRDRGVAHKLYFGVEYYREILSQPSLSLPSSITSPINVFQPIYGRVSRPPAGAVLLSTLTSERLESASLSVQDRVDAGPWTMVAGLRYMQQNFLYGNQGTLPVREARWSPKLALLRRWTEDDTLYASFASGTSPNQVATATQQSLPSRRSSQSELGWKSLWLGGRVVSEVAAFRLDQKNMISADETTPLVTSDFTTAGSGRSQGVEASLIGDVDDRLSLALNYAYTRARYLENAQYARNAVPNVARHSASLWAQFKWDAYWRTGVGLYAQSQRFGDQSNSVVLPGYARFDLVQTWIKPLKNNASLEFQLAIRNLFDRRYFVSSHLHVTQWITPGQGRNAAVQVTYRF